MPLLIHTARWLWLPVMLGILGTGVYLLSALRSFDDSASLASDVAELRQFQEQMLTYAGTQYFPSVLADVTASSPVATPLNDLRNDVLRASAQEAPASEAIAQQTRSYVRTLVPRIEARLPGSDAPARLERVADQFAVFAELGSALETGELSVQEVVLEYAVASGQANTLIDGVLDEIGAEGQRAAAEARQIATIGIGIVLIGGLISGAGFGWASWQARRYQADIERAQEIDRLKSEFVGLASHELRTPLTGILGYAELLEDWDGLEAEPQAWAHRVSEEAGHLSVIVEDLLNVSRIETDGLTIKTAPLPLSPLMDEIDAHFTGGRRDEAHPLVIDRADEVVALADGEKLREVLINLIDNAIKYSPDGGAVLVRITGDETMARISVSDQGIGIADTDIEQLFDRFNRIDREDMASIRGTGLGLYIVKEFVEAMDGDVGVESVPGRGSTFTVALPRESALETAA